MKRAFAALAITFICANSQEANISELNVRELEETNADEPISSTDDEQKDKTITQEKPEEESKTECVEKEPDLSKVEWWRWILILGLITLSGCFSGLNLGVLGLDTHQLERLT